MSGVVEVKRQSFFTSAVDVGEWLPSGPGRFIPAKKNIDMH
jgi:hypothetical protein